MDGWMGVTGLAGGTCSGRAFAHAEQQLHAQGNACVPPQREDADVARHDGRAQEVLHRASAV